MSESTIPQPPLPFTEPQLAARLRELGIATRTIRHPPVFTVDEAKARRGELSGAHTKNLFLKDKKGAAWLVVAGEDRAVDLRALQKQLGAAKSLSFGDAALLRAILGVEPGSVTPFAAINDREGCVTVVVDAELMEADLITVHPLVNTATTAIAPHDLVRFLESTGHVPLILALPARAP